MKIEIIVVLIFAVIILTLASKEMYDLSPNTIGGNTPYACAPGPGITDTKWCQATTKAIAEAKCSSLTDCMGYSLFKGDPKKFGGGITTAQLIGITQFKPIPNVEWDFYRKGVTDVVQSPITALPSFPSPVPGLPSLPSPVPPQTAPKRAMLNQDQLNRLARGEEITISY